jgi:arylsulfatase
MKRNPSSKISRRELFKSGAAAALAFSVSRRGLKALAARDRMPNILMLMTDQQRGDCLGADGHPVVQTPHLDRLAAEGIRFRCGYSSTPTCTPARGALLTGQDPWNHGMLGYHRVAERYPFEMPRALAEAGYRTVGLGKMHYSPQRADHGFQQLILDESGRVQSPDFISDYRAWFKSEAPTLDPDATGIGWNSYRAGAYVLPERLHPTHWTGETAVRFLKNYEESAPFFLKVSFARPHSPYDPPQRLMDMYQDAAIPAPFAGTWSERYRERSGNDDTIWHGDLGADQARHSRQGYYGSVTHIDEQIGRIVDTLESRGLLEQTLIVFFSDHGDMTGDHHMWRKSYAYEPSARVPFLMRWPDGLASGRRGQVLDHPVEIRDIFPTFLEAAGAPGAERTDGQNLLGLVPEQKSAWRPWIDLEHDVCYDRRNHWSALTDGHTKYIFHAIDGEEQLFDLDQDPGEERDLAGDAAHAATLRTWRSRLIEYLEPRGKDWVKGGQLALRPESIKLSPNYPAQQSGA